MQCNAMQCNVMQSNEVSKYVCRYVCMCVCMRACVYVCVCVRACMHAWMHGWTYSTQVHTHIPTYLSCQRGSQKMIEHIHDDLNPSSVWWKAFCSPLLPVLGGSPVTLFMNPGETWGNGGFWRRLLVVSVVLRGLLVVSLGGLLVAY